MHGKIIKCYTYPYDNMLTKYFQNTNPYPLFILLHCVSFQLPAHFANHYAFLKFCFHHSNS